jgi:hypothetical protein
MRDERVADLNLIVDASVSAVHVWMYDQRINAQLFADGDQLRPFRTVDLSCLFATSFLPQADETSGAGNESTSKSTGTIQRS